MDFPSDANFEGLLEVNRGICMPQMAEKTSPDVPPDCAVVSLIAYIKPPPVETISRGRRYNHV